MIEVRLERASVGASLLLLVIAFLGETDPLRGESQAGLEVDQREVCLACHDLEDALAAPVRHEPVAAGECVACHNPHVARVEGLLSDQPAILCASCHSELPDQLRLEVVHKPVEQGRCLDCHEPHGGRHDGLLSEDGRALCAGCHAEVATLGTLPVQHSPFRKDQCDRCHDPHASQMGGLLTATESALCARCHPVSAAFKAKHSDYPVEKASCGACHDPHAAGEPGLLKPNVHEPFRGGDCETCHAAASSAQPFALRMPEAQLCGECHDEQVADAMSASFPHVSAGGGRCTACHNPHAGEGEALLNSSQLETCTQCHDPGGASSGLPGRYETHAGDLECTTCHAPHGAERPLMLAKDPVELCNECHSHQHGVSHPLGEQVRDPRTGMPMDCGACHGIHHAPYEMYLHASGEGDVCVGCHRDKLRGGR